MQLFQYINAVLSISLGGMYIIWELASLDWVIRGQDSPGVLVCYYIDPNEYFLNIALAFFLLIGGVLYFLKPKPAAYLVLISILGYLAQVYLHYSGDDYYMIVELLMFDPFYIFYASLSFLFFSAILILIQPYKPFGTKN